MKKEQVPQDNASTYEGHKRLLYATDDIGNYDRVQSSGWEAEEFATSLAVNEFHRLAKNAWFKAKAGESSPLEYHMYCRRMDIALLAQTSGLFQWRIRRHLKPKYFTKLSPALLKRYSEALDLPVETLQQLPTAPHD